MNRRKMAPLRCVSYNCRGWNNGIISLNSFVDSFDISFLQEHWLIEANLHKIGDLSSDFSFVCVSAMVAGADLGGGFRGLQPPQSPGDPP